VVSGDLTLDNATEQITTFHMLLRDVTVLANWLYIAPPPPPIYSVTVEGSYAVTRGEGSYPSGATVTINAGTRAGYTFKGWAVTSGGITLTDANSAAITFTMPSNDVVVTANWTTNNSWALVNLILCTIGALAVLFALIRSFIQKDKTTRWIWLAIAVIAGIAGVVVFFLTENMSLTMQYVDWWTIANAAILLLGIIGLAFASKNKERKASAQ
jgi:uncharacterized repeat protein (TIGR02543 family)